ncbi:Extracellular sulfatase C-terminal [Trinorchestia longiramus]|nr:Extracellular sulfatase C-terminal [Trinorchestia longiramus]
MHSFKLTKKRRHDTWAALITLITIACIFITFNGANAQDEVQHVSRHSSPSTVPHEHNTRTEHNLLTSNDGVSTVSDNFLRNDEFSLKKNHRRQFGRKKNRESRRVKKRMKRRKSRAKQERKRGKANSLHGVHRERVTPEDLNLRWSAARNTWESTSNEDQPSVSAHQIITRSSTQNTEGFHTSSLRDERDQLDARRDDEELHSNSVRPSIKFETYREDHSPFTSIPSSLEDRGSNVRGRTDTILESSHLMNDRSTQPPGVNSKRSSHSGQSGRPRTGLPGDRMTGGYSYSSEDVASSKIAKSVGDRLAQRNLRNKGEGPIIRSGYWSRRYSIKLPANYVSGRAARQSAFGKRDNSSGNLLNPFDHVVDGDTSATTVESPQSHASSSRIRSPHYNFSDTGISSDHFSLNLNSTLSTPHYYRVLDTMNRPITPFNWRRPHPQRKNQRSTWSHAALGRHNTSTLAELPVSEEVDDPRSEPVSSAWLGYRTSHNNSSDTFGRNETVKNSQNWAIQRNARSFYPSNNLPTANISGSARSNFMRLRPAVQKRGSAPEALYLRRRNRPTPSITRHGPEKSNDKFRFTTSPSSGSSPGETASPRPEKTSGFTDGDKASPVRRPNIVVVITDDLDVELGSLNYMPRLQRLLREGGGLFPHSYTTTPMCCPSRSSMLTGMYIHNHEVYTNNDNCSSTRWQETHEQRTFATFLRDAGYNTGYFGKYLNKYKGPYTPAGWRDWMGLRLNSRYYNYTVFKNGVKFKYGDSYPRDYFPHVITNEGIRFMRENSARRHGFPRRSDDGGGGPPGRPPMLLVLSYPAPHGPEDAAPEHSTLFLNATDHHTVAYDYAPNPDKQWILQYTDRMSPIKLKFTNVLMSKRLQTLQTVDLAIERVVSELVRLGELENTYIFFTSDHGYHLGQFGLIKGKSMPFEFDVKVPLFVRGPGIVPRTEFSEIALNVDLAPTFLDIGGVEPPAHMDGRSLLPVLQRQSLREKWRHSFLVESSGRHRDEEVLEMKAQKRYQQFNRLLERQARINITRQNIHATASLLDVPDLFTPPIALLPYLSSTPSSPLMVNNSTFSNVGAALDQLPLYTSKHEHLEVVCQSEDLQAPCTSLKKWRCEHDGFRWRLKKCRQRVNFRRTNCVCGPEHGMGYLVRLDSEERRRQRDFLRQHVSGGQCPVHTSRVGRSVSSSHVTCREVSVQFTRHVSGGQCPVHMSRVGRSVSSSHVTCREVSVQFTRHVSGGQCPVHTSCVGRSLSSSHVTCREVIVHTRVNADVTHLLCGCADLSDLSPRFLKAFVDVDSREVARENLRQRSQRRSSRIARSASSEAPAVDDASDAAEYQGVDWEDAGVGFSVGGEQGFDRPTEDEEVSGVVLTEHDVLGGDHAETEDPVHAYVEEEELKDIERQIQDIFTELQDLEVASNSSAPAISVEHTNDTLHEAAGGCVTVGGSEVDCPTEVYLDKHVWRNSKHAIDEEIRRLGHQMRMLKVIRQHLRRMRPRGSAGESFLEFDEDLTDLEESSEMGSGDGRREGARGLYDISAEPPTMLESGGDVSLGTRGSTSSGPSGGDTLGPGTEDPTVVGFGVDDAEEDNGGGEVFDSHRGEDDVNANSTDPNHFSYTGGYRGNKGNRVAVYVPRQRSVCWCNKRVALQLHQQEQKLRRLEERQRLRQLRAERRKARRDKKRKQRRQLKERPCNLSHQNCYHHDNTHWKTPPLWHDGSFCACLNSANNTYWCVRSINATHNTLYCEFITGLITYYDLNIDPYQLRNVAFMLADEVVTDLHNTLTRLRSCRGYRQCDLLEDSRDEATANISSTNGHHFDRRPGPSLPRENPFLTRDSGLSLFGSDEIAFDDLSEEDRLLEAETNATNYRWSDFVPLNTNWELQVRKDGAERHNFYNIDSTQSVLLVENELKDSDWLENRSTQQPSEQLLDTRSTSAVHSLPDSGRRTSANTRGGVSTSTPADISQNTKAENVSDYSALYNGEKNVQRAPEHRQYLSSGRRRQMSGTDGVLTSNDVTIEHDIPTNYFGESGVASAVSGHRVYRTHPFTSKSMRPSRTGGTLGGSVRREGDHVRAHRPNAASTQTEDGRRRSKKEHKKHKKELRRLRQEQKRRRLEQLLAEYARQQLNETSSSNNQLERRRKRRLKRWRRLERRLQQMTATSGTEGGRPDAADLN